MAAFTTPSTGAAAFDNCWLLALAAKCSDASPYSLLSAVAVFLLAWLVTALLYWTYPGGPAWGRHRWSTAHRAGGHRSSKAIPGPNGFPVLGSMGLMSGLAHRRIALVAASIPGARRLMAFSLGSTRVVVTCDPDVAREILHSPSFADRPVKESAYHLMFNRAIGFAPYGAYWRTLRRISSTHLFCPKQIAAAEAQRFDIAAQMVAVLRNRTGGDVRVREVVRGASLCNMMGSVFGRSYKLGAAGGEADELRVMVEEGYELLGTTNWSDHLPFLARFDPQLIQLRCSKLVPRVNRFVSRIIEEHRDRTGFMNGDFVDVLLSLQGPDKLADSDMVAVLWEMIFRGTDTVAVLIEWVLARLVLHPEIQRAVHEELDRVVGQTNPVKEPDLPSLTYLQAVIKEVLRLHPPGPLLSWARLATSDTVVDGRHVPAETTAMVNMWAISQDPAVWPDPLTFQPDRFLAGAGQAEFSLLGSDLRLAPFGSGRRSCPGKMLGLTAAGFWVATLMHEFAWSESEGNQVSLSESLRLSCEMAEPLTVSLQPRRS